LKAQNIDVFYLHYLERGFSFKEAVLIGGEALAVEGEGCITPHKLPLILARSSQ
jgi:hypothetical protein